MTLNVVGFTTLRYPQDRMVNPRTTHADPDVLKRVVESPKLCSAGHKTKTIPMRTFSGKFLSSFWVSCPGPMYPALNHCPSHCQGATSEAHSARSPGRRAILSPWVRWLMQTHDFPRNIIYKRWVSTSISVTGG